MSSSEEDAPTVIRAPSTPDEAATWISGSSRPRASFSLPAPGQTLAGRYMVFEMLGQGGMGVVLAAYDTRLDRRVALKLLRPDESAEPSLSDGEARMVREAQAMARLNHPHVVAVYDAGTLQSGSLFIAMEYVEGQTLRQWREQQPRSWREVLAAYLAAGKGLAAAHAAGLIHRDFKPDNVLVGKDGRVRVMDFGLARAAPELGPTEPLPASVPAESLSSALTVPGTLLGTPRYMAPELMRGEPAGVRSDLYAFCVALYEALYDQLPVADGLRARLEGLITPPPSSSEVPAWVGRTLLQGLQGAAAQRPASMEALLAALQDDPELKRQSRRRVLAVASLGVVLAGLAVWGWARQQSQEPTCAQVARRLDGVWDAPVKQRLRESLRATGLPYAGDTAERVSTVLEDYAGRWVKQSTALCEADQATLLPRLATLRESCLERRLSRLRATTELLSQGADQALLEKATQAVYSLPPLEDCTNDEALTAAVPPPEDPAVRAKVEALLPQVDTIETLIAAGKYKEGLSAAEALLPQVAPVGHAPLYAQVLLLTARLKDAAGDYKGGEEGARQALVEASRGRDPLQVSRALNLLSYSLGHRQQRHEEVTPLVPVVRALAESTGDALTQATAYNNLGRILIDQGKYPEARESHSRALALREQALGPEHPEVATSIFNLAMVDWWMGHYEQALANTERAAALKQKALGPEHPDVVLLSGNTGGMLYEVGRYEEALQRYQHSLRGMRKLLGPEHPLVAQSLGNLSIVLQALGRYEEARDHSAQALALREKLFGAEDLELAGPLGSLGGALSGLGRHAEALEAHTRVLALREKALGSQHALVAEALRYRGIELVHLKRFREAREHLERALVSSEKALGPEHPELAYPLEALGLLLVAQGRPAEALGPLERAQKLAPEGNIRAEVRFTLGRALWEARSAQRAQAVALVTQARDAWGKLGNPVKQARASEWLAAHPSP
ncbi:MAG TPA: serine/threonine-protein kinase [Myxococcaceae bacterium]|jgi:serine/threonine-protein kinase